MKQIKNDRLLQTIQDKKVLIAAHRGTWGGNIIQNTIGAYETSLLSGAHIIEVDVVQSTDGDFFAFHTGQEPGLLRIEKNLKEMTTAEIEACKFTNCTQEFVSEKINRLDDILEHFKNRCLINIDRSWWFWEDTIKLLKRHNMPDQIILKSAPEKELLRVLQNIGAELMYMPIIRREGQLETAKNYAVNLIGTEIIFNTEESPLVTNSFIDNLHNEGLLAWANAITLDDTTYLSAGHDDNTSILQNMDKGWGWIIDKGFDIIQTDWPLHLSQYIKNNYGKGEKI